MTPRERLDELAARWRDRHLSDADRLAREHARNAEYLRRRGLKDADDEPDDGPGVADPYDAEFR